MRNNDDLVEDLVFLPLHGEETAIFLILYNFTFLIQFRNEIVL